MTEQYPRASKTERDSCVVTVAEVPTVNLAPGIDTNLVCGKDLTLSFATLAPHSMGKMHSHPHEQMAVILEGSVDFILSGKSYALKAGDVIHVAGNLEHTGITGDVTCKMVEVFTPARKDFEEKLAQAKAAKK